MTRCGLDFAFPQPYADTPLALLLCREDLPCGARRSELVLAVANPTPVSAPLPHEIASIRFTVQVQDRTAEAMVIREDYWITLVRSY